MNSPVLQDQSTAADAPFAGEAAEAQAGVTGEALSLRGRRKKKKKRRALWIALIAVAIAGGGGWWAWRHHVAAEAAKAINPADLVAVSRGIITHAITSSGKIVPNLEVEIKCRAGGEVIKLPFDISQRVKKGDLLCQLDTTDEDLLVRSANAAVAQAQAKLAQAQANLNTAQLNLQTTRTRAQAALESAKVKAKNLRSKAERQKQLVAQNLGSSEDFETAQTEAAVAESDLHASEMAVEELKQQEIQLQYKTQDVNSAAAQLDSDQIALDSQKQQLQYTTVLSPMDGAVSALNVQKGQIIASGLNAINGGTSIMTLTDLSHVFAMATVDESDIGGVSVGQKATITVSSFPRRTFAGHVVRIAVKGVNSSNVVTFEVKVEVDDPNKELLKPEMTGDVTIVEAEHQNVLLAAADAIIHKNGKTLVKLQDGSERQVTTGLEGVENVEILSGLSEGEKVVGNGAAPPSKFSNDNQQGG